MSCQNLEVGNSRPPIATKYPPLRRRAHMKKQTHPVRHLITLGLTLVALVSWFALPRNCWNWIESTAFAAATFTVNSAGDEADASVGDGICKIESIPTRNPTCTLRAAIQEANATAALDTISFSIGSGVHTISPTSGLPQITAPVIVDGTTQPGFVGKPIIELTGLPGNHGLFITGTASGCTVKGLVINSFFTAILLKTDNNVVQGNFLGTDVTGTIARGNAYGIVVVSSNNNVIGGVNAGEGNLISGNDKGIQIDDESGAPSIFNLIQGNFIGTDVNGTARLSNAVGVTILSFGFSASADNIGGTTGTTPGGRCTGACNVISGNSGDAIQIKGTQAVNNHVRGNYIGTDVNGVADLGNSGAGILLDGANNTIIGGTEPAARNVISGNGDHAIKIKSSATSNTVAGNYIGVNTAGAAFPDTGSSGTGVFVIDSANNQIGLAGAGNVISGNALGIAIVGSTATNNTIMANYIGTDATGTIQLGNFGGGIAIQTANNNTVGGTTPAERNVISGNLNPGITILSGATGNKVQGNYIGTKADGTEALGNGGAGVSLNGSNNNTVGGTASSEGNVIAFNNGDGVLVIGSSSTGNPILSNSIHDNSGLGIDLLGGIENSFGVTQNDPGGGDGDTGPNNLQNFPELTSALTYPSFMIVHLSINSAASSRYGIEFFANTTCDSSSNGEGQTLLNDVLFLMNTDAGGNHSAIVSLPEVPAGHFLTATATKLDASGNPTDTSEFSQCRAVTAPGLLRFSAASYTVNENGSATITVTRTGGSDGNVSVNYATSNGTATDGADYTGVSGNLGFGDGEVTRTFTVPIIDDSFVEGNETVNLTLSSPTGGALLGSPNTAVLTIADNDDPSAPSLSISDVIVREGHGAVFTITLSPASTSTVTVNVINADGSAIAGSDYQSIFPGGSVTFHPGDTTRLLAIGVNNDSVAEGNETFFINLSSPVNANIADDQGMATIIDAGSSLPTIQLNTTLLTGTEECTGVNVTVTRAGDSSGVMTVDYATSDGTVQFTTTGVAQQKTDYTLALGTLTFEAGVTSKSFPVLITEDSYVEGTEALTITLSNATGGAVLASPNIAALRILDDSTEPPGNPNDDAQTFVCQHYHDFLNREPDAMGLSHWTNDITSCGTDAQCIDIKRQNVSAAFFVSIEFQETGYLVYRIYKSAFGNLPGKPVPVRYTEFLRDTQQIGRNVQVGIGDWQTQLENNKQAFALNMVQRSDFRSAYPASLTADQFVNQLDVNAGGVLSADEKSTLVAVLGATPADAAKRAMVLRSVAEDQDLRSAEFNKAFVLMQYFGYLRRNPDDLPDTDYSGWQYWLNKLIQFNGNYIRAEMVRAFIVSIEYRERFGP